MTARPFPPVTPRAIALALLVAAAATGCSVREALEAQPGTDLSELKPGTPRAKVETVLGEPIKTMKTRDGVVYRTYFYREPTAPRGDLALANAGLDVVTFGMWELVRTKSGYLENRPLGTVLAVTYDKSDQVIDVFPDFNLLPGIPADGRRTAPPPQSASTTGAATAPAGASMPAARPSEPLNR
jgi:hypothetical protein